MPQQVVESFVSFEGVTKASIDREAGVVRNVKIIGFESKNGRTYTEKALKEGVHKYEGAKVNLDHPDKANQARSVRDRFGNLRNVRFVEGDGNRGDFHYNPKHAYAEQFAWEVENNPANVGFSHNAMVDGGRKGGKLIVESIVDVKSVDLVADPATTNGVFESVDTEEGVISDKLKNDAEHSKFRKTVDAAISLIRQTLWNDEITLTMAKSNVQTIANDLVAELSSPTTTEDEDMKKLEEMTLEDIRKARPELFVSEKDDELKTLREKLEAMEAEKVATEFKEKVRSELKASKLTEGQVSESFETVLFSTTDDTVRAALITDRENICEGQKVDKKNGTQKPVSAVSEGEGSGPSGSLTTAGLASALGR